MSESKPLVPVKQCDRDAAADYYASCAPFDRNRAAITQLVRLGEFDDRANVQAFARHRTAAEASACELELVKKGLAG